MRLRDREPIRCALCHDDLQGAVDGCPLCGTALHPECASELGRCPTLGCPVGIDAGSRVDLPTFAEAMEGRDGALVRYGAWLGAGLGLLVGAAIPIEATPAGGPAWALVASAIRGAMTLGLLGSIVGLAGRALVFGQRDLGPIQPPGAPVR